MGRIERRDNHQPDTPEALGHQASERCRTVLQEHTIACADDSPVGEKCFMPRFTMLGVEVGNDPFDGRMLDKEILDGMFRGDTCDQLRR